MVRQEKREGKEERMAQKPGWMGSWMMGKLEAKQWGVSWEVVKVSLSAAHRGAKDKGRHLGI